MIDLQGHLKAAHAQQSQVFVIRAGMAKDIMCAMLASKEVHTYENLAKHAVCATDALLCELGLQRKADDATD